jgi:ferredoxin
LVQSMDEGAANEACAACDECVVACAHAFFDLK